MAILSQGVLERTSDTRAGRIQCEAGRKVQSAREAAGLTREDLAHRSHLASHERSNLVHGKHYDYECPTAECVKQEPQHVKWIRTAERTSQQQFDKKKAERAARGFDQDTPYGRFWNTYIDLIDLASVEASETELREAIRQYVIEERAAVDATRERKVAERARSLADAALSGVLTPADVEREFNFEALTRALLIVSERRAADD